MDMRPIVHIGFHKTATTWFQEIFYPAVKNGHFVPRDVARSAIIEPRAFDFDPETARTKLEIQEERILVCEENLSGYIHNGALGGLLSKTVADRLQLALPKAHIVIFIRSQLSIIAASYAQYVKGGGTSSPRDYIYGQSRRVGALKYWYKAPYFALEHLKYHAIIAYYISLFGKSSVHIFIYEDFLENKNTFIRNFCDCLNLEVEVDALNYEARNSSLDRRDIIIIRMLNYFTNRSVLDKRYVISLNNWYDRRWKILNSIKKILRKSDKNPMKLESKLSNEIISYFSSDNRKVSQELGIDLERYGYPFA
jgi:hypothetical protein